MRRWVIRCLLMCIPLTGCNGGGKESKIWVSRTPDFYRPELKRIAVIPFGAKCGNPVAARHLSDKLEAMLVNNKTYEVYTRQHLKDVLSEQDLSAAGIVDGELAKKIGRLGSVQAIICGDCSRYVDASQQVTVPEWVYVRGGNGYIRNVQRTQHVAVVECNLVVIDTETGKQLAAVQAPTQIAWVEGTKYPYKGLTVMQSAEAINALTMLQGTAMTRSQIKLKGTVLRTATGQYDAKWDWADRITSETEKIHAVIKLPLEASRNNFKVTIVPKEQREIIAEQNFVWPDGSTENSYLFDVKPIVDKHGLGAYTIKLYSGPQPIAWYNFDIVKSHG